VTAFLFITLVKTLSFLLATITVGWVLLTMVNEAVQIVISNLRSIPLTSRISLELSVLLLTAIESILAHLLTVSVLSGILLK
jgi:hypothetical protein